MHCVIDPGVDVMLIVPLGYAIVCVYDLVLGRDLAGLGCHPSKKHFIKIICKWHCFLRRHLPPGRQGERGGK